jgi:hypothetical protein
MTFKNSGNYYEANSTKPEDAIARQRNFDFAVRLASRSVHYVLLTLDRLAGLEECGQMAITHRA